jgi:antiviral helicase SLH1
MCRATEYDELPVRHNEDLINAELSANLPLKADAFGLPMWDPHVKAFLLLQAHFSRIDLPISDYVGDQNSVLDQSIRIIQASIDVLTELGYLQSCRMMVTLLQCVKSARWPDDGPLAIFPGVDVAAEKKRLQANEKPSMLVEATEAPRPQIAGALSKLHVPKPSHDRVFKALDRLPRLQLTVSDVTALGFNVGISRLNTTPDRQYRIYAPRYPKPQSEGFFVIVSDAAKGDIVALKRVSWPSADRNRGAGNGKPSTRTIIKLPQSDVGRNVKVEVMSDSYIGMAWQVDDVEVPAAPKVVDDGSKKAQ